MFNFCPRSTLRGMYLELSEVDRGDVTEFWDTQSLLAPSWNTAVPTIPRIPIFFC